MAAVAFAYQAIALAAALRHLSRRENPSGYAPPVSVLKPVHGLDPHFYECIRSHAMQDYPEFEILFGVSDPADPAIPEIQRLAEALPERGIRLIFVATRAPNPKVGVLADLAAAARHPVLVINDSDIWAPPDYLRHVAAPLADPRIGVVTCLYRARAERWPGRLEAVGIATDFTPGVLVAPLVGVSEFGLGATLVCRAADLVRAGGFAAIADFLADDYQFSRHIRQLGLRVFLSRLVVETWLGDRTWAEVWRHQLRWARTIRVSRGGGYTGLFVTHATFWSLALWAAGLGWAAAALFTMRMASGLAAAAALRDRDTLRDFFLIPLRDLWGTALWISGLFGSEVEWRGLRLRLDRQGRIVGVRST
jgi:ceramide glucosyltransferase